jgi:hypothetical protein
MASGVIYIIPLAFEAGVLGAEGFDQIGKLVGIYLPRPIAAALA